MKIAVITPRFAIAGVPLAQVRFANALSRHGHEVDLVIGHIENVKKFPKIESINLINLRKKRVSSMFIPLRRYIINNKPEIIFSAEDHLNAMVLLLAILTKSSVKVSCSSRVTPYDTYSDMWFTKRWFLKLIMKSVMWRANCLTCVSVDMVDQYKKVFKNSKHINIYNIIYDKFSKSRIAEKVSLDWFNKKDSSIIIAAGKLAPWKGFDILIEAFKVVSEKKNVRLILLGDGPMRLQLESLIKKNNLSKLVILMGYVENPLKYFANSDVFVLSSYVEGLPNVLVEAMMCGCTPVSTNCATGPKEILKNGKYGYLVPVGNPRELAKGIVKAIENPISKNLLDKAIIPFKESEIIKNHLNVLGI